MWLWGDRRAWLRVGLLALGLLLVPALVWFAFPVRRRAPLPVASVVKAAPAGPAAASGARVEPGAKRPAGQRPAASTEVRGVVLDATGHGVEKATVRCIDRDDDTSAITDPKGAFRMPASAVGCTAVATHDAHGSSPTTTLSGAGPNRLEFIPSAKVTGEVVDESGRAVSKYKLSIESFVAAEGAPTQRPSAQVRVIDDPRGAFEWGGLPPGTYTFAASAEGFAPGRSDSIELDVGKTATTKITLSQGGKLSGKVTDAGTGKALGGVSVDAAGNGTVTAANGSYELSGIPTFGALTVTFSLDGYRRKMVTLQGGASVAQDVALTSGEGVEYGGIGATLRRPQAPGASPFALTADTKGGPFVVGTLMPDSPAGAAGVRVGDEFVEIDGVSTATLTMAEVLDRLRGPEGTVVRVRLSRDGGQTQDVSITRKVMVR